MTVLGYGVQYISVPSRVASVILAITCLVACSSPGGSKEPGNLSVGSTGPGGGLVFYVAKEPFPCGPNLASSCTYLEVSPAESDHHIAWSSGSLDTYPNNNWAYQVAGADNSAIGSGLQNTIDIVSQGGNDPDSSAAAYAHSYEYGGLDDWFLPSAGELNQLCKFARYAADTDPSIQCSKTGPLRLGFAPTAYWSSTEHSDTAALQQYFYQLELEGAGEFRHPGNFKNKTLRVRPVRAG